MAQLTGDAEDAARACDENILNRKKNRRPEVRGDVFPRSHSNRFGLVLHVSERSPRRGVAIVDSVCSNELGIGGVR